MRWAGRVDTVGLRAMHAVESGRRAYLRVCDGEGFLLPYAPLLSVPGPWRARQQESTHTHAAVEAPDRPVLLHPLGREVADLGLVIDHVVVACIAPPPSWC